MYILFTFLFLISLLLLVVGLINPNVIARLIRTTLPRKQLSLIFISSALVFFILVGITAPKTDLMNTETETNQQKIEAVTQQPVGLADAAVQPTSAGNAKTTAMVSSVVDGDTIKVTIASTTETIRLIGIDTPETVDPRKPVQCFGVEASNKSKSILQGKTIQLESDPPQGERDKYGRLLRYVFLGDGTNFNEMMIREGYAYEYTYNLPYKYQTVFKQAQSEAQANKRGLWAKNTCNGSNIVNNEQPTSLSSSTQPVPVPIPTPPSAYSCSIAKSCGDMASCDEAYFYLNTCYKSSLDRDKDGIPCEDICK